jgi:lipid II:glycine glycyltransferase (peptidoglycan interpeptide bridge formation enzyme)
MFALKPIYRQTVWEKFLLASNQVNFLHSWQWGEMQRRLFRPVFRWGLYRDSRLAGLIQLIKVKAKRATYFECPGGPVIDWRQPTVHWLLAYLKAWAKTEGASFIRLRPNILANRENLALVYQAGARRAPMHLTAETTWVLPLEPAEAVLLAGMRKTTRYLIRKAAKLGVAVTASAAVADIDQLFALQAETVGRKHFVPFSREYFLAELRAFAPDHIRLFKASIRGKLLAIAMIIFYGREAVYHYSGSSSEYRDIPASYLLQWEVIKFAKKIGCRRYNFWGYTDNPRHRFFGPSLFKQGFGGQRLDYLPAHDLIVAPAYWFNFAVETWRRHWRRL